MARPRVGAVLRSSPATARLLTHARVFQLKRGDSGELRQFVRHSRPRTMTIDVGASVGNFALASARAVGRLGHVLALEANPEVFEELVRSTWGSRVIPLNIAASNGRGVARFEVPRDSAGGSIPPLGSLEHRTGTAVTAFDVRTLLVDDLVPPASEVSAIKIDVEGHELAVLEGSIETITRCRPALVVEIEQRHLRGSTVEEVVQWLLGFGYQAWGIAGRDLLRWSQFDSYEWQGRWLDGRNARLPSSYVNNFLFLPD